MSTLLTNLRALRSRLADQSGQSLVEWALILALVAVVAVAILGTIGTNVVSQLTSIANAL